MALLNGRIPTLLLKYVGTNTVGKKLYIRAGTMARSLSLLLRFWILFVKAGALPINDAYRDLAGQRAALAYWTRLGTPWKAATPGTSNHGWAISVDFGGQLLSSTSMGHEFARWFFPLLGWEWDGRKWGEPWHWTFRGWPPRPTLKQGSRGNVVKLWQAYIRLTNTLIDGKKIRIDGVFGPGTVAYTKAWQRRKRLTPDGVVGARSWRKARLA